MGKKEGEEGTNSGRMRERNKIKRRRESVVLHQTSQSYLWRKGKKGRREGLYKITSCRVGRYDELSTQKSMNTLGRGKRESNYV